MFGGSLTNFLRRGLRDMTNEELQAHIEAINDAIAAREIEERVHATADFECPVLNRIIIGDGLREAGYALRIKPKPREFYLSVSDLKSVRRRQSQGAPQAIDVYRREEGFNRDGHDLYLRVREVIE
jgi:hypothetical protein